MSINPVGFVILIYSPDRVILLVIGPAGVAGQPGKRDGKLVCGAGDVVRSVRLGALDDELRVLY